MEVLRLCICQNIFENFSADETAWVFNQADQDNDDKLSKMELISLMFRSFIWSSNRFLQFNNKTAGSSKNIIKNEMKRMSKNSVCAENKVFIFFFE